MDSDKTPLHRSRQREHRRTHPHDVYDVMAEGFATEKDTNTGAGSEVEFLRALNLLRETTPIIQPPHPTPTEETPTPPSTIPAIEIYLTPRTPETNPTEPEPHPHNEPEEPEEIDTTPVCAEEMTGIWLTTVTGHTSPVWLDGEPAEPEDLGVPDDISDRLRDWAELWNTQWHPDSGWLPRARITDYEALGQWLGRRVKDASGAVTVTVQLSHLGRAGITVVQPPETRQPVRVLLMNDYGLNWPIWVADDADFVTEYGVGSFSSEINARIEAWTAQFHRYMNPQTGWQAPHLATHYAETAEDLVLAIAEELGPDYLVELDLWELHLRQPPRRN